MQIQSIIRTLFLLLVASFSTRQAKAQQTVVTSEKQVAVTTKKQPSTIMPDDKTVILDEKGDTITQQQLVTILSSGGFTMDPQIENGRINYIRLRRNGVNLAIGSTPPDFTAADTSGKVYTLKNLKGKIVVLNFWFTHCTGCIEELPQLNQLAYKYKSDTNIVFLAPTFDNAEKVNNFLTKHDFSYTILPEQKAVIGLYGIQIFPFNVIIDKNNRIAFFGASADSHENVSDKLSRIIEQLKN